MACIIPTAFTFTRRSPIYKNTLYYDLSLERRMRWWYEQMAIIQNKKKMRMAWEEYKYPSDSPLQQNPIQTPSANTHMTTTRPIPPLPPTENLKFSSYKALGKSFIIFQNARSRCPPARFPARPSSLRNGHAKYHPSIAPQSGQGPWAQLLHWR